MELVLGGNGARERSSVRRAAPRRLRGVRGLCNALHLGCHPPIAFFAHNPAPCAEAPMDEASPWAGAPPDILRTVFSLVLEECDGDTRDMLAVGSVCSLWRAVANSDARLWCNLDLDSVAEELTDERLAVIIGRAEGGLTHASLENAIRITDSSIQLFSLAKAPKLAGLSVTDCHEVSAAAIIKARDGASEPLDWLRVDGIEPLSGTAQELIPQFEALLALGVDEDTTACTAPRSYDRQQRCCGRLFLGENGLGGDMSDDPFCNGRDQIAK